MTAEPARDDGKPPGMPGTHPDAVEPESGKHAGQAGLRHFVTLFLFHPIVIVVALALLAWVVWTLL